MEYATAISTGPPPDYGRRIKSLRGVRELTQGQLAELIGVSYASVNRWENGQSRPNRLAWRRIVELESQAGARIAEAAPAAAYEASTPPPWLDFAAGADAVAAVAEAHRLAYGHLVNPSFATETSLIDPLPHQRIAVYEHMLRQAPLRFLLADDAGAGKTIMTGLYVREMLSRRLIHRVLVVPPAGLVGNWEREMRTLFRLPFRIAGGADAGAGNPFLPPAGDLVITSIDTLAGKRLFGRLADPATPAYDLVIFDEAHKLSARREPNFRMRKTDRYRLAETLAGAGADGRQWELPWSARHLLLLTATPHMGEDDPYYFLWRLLLPDALATGDAFDRFPPESRRNHFLRRTKEEMVRLDGAPLYPQRRCDTLSYELSQGPASEQDLYDETTDYIRSYYNRARVLNRSAARLAMSVFQRRLASSTYALMRSFERRHEKLAALIAALREGRLSEEQIARGQRHLDDLDDEFETRTADEDAGTGGRERLEAFEERALGATAAENFGELEVERRRVAALLDMTRRRLAAGDESKFGALREVLRDPRFGGEKLIVFTEHRDTAQFLVRRLEGLGFAGRVALIHGGLPYRERDRQVELFRLPAAAGGADYLVATDAAGEGINLQFCWLMVNYDIPWNPARLEQRMGRIHRYGQAHDPVVVVNLVSGGTREGRVLQTLLDKLEAIRRQLRSDKVFDVVGRLFQGISVRDLLLQAVTGDGADAATRLEGRLTQEQVLALAQQEQARYGTGGEVRRRLADLAGAEERAHYRRLLPGYVRRFVALAAPLLDLRIEGDLEATFALAPRRPGAADTLLPALEAYSDAARGRLTVYQPKDRERAVWLHPGEPVFDAIASAVLSRCGASALRGAVFVDPHATEAYLFHVGLAAVHQQLPAADQDSGPEAAARLLESRLIGLRQSADGTVQESAVERLLLLCGATGRAPSLEPLAAQARGLVPAAAEFARGQVAERLAADHRQRLAAALPSRVEFANRGFDFQAAELADMRASLAAQARAGVRSAQVELAQVKERQRTLAAARARRLAELHAAADSVQTGDVEFLVHALVVPSDDAKESERFDAEVEAIAVRVAATYEEHSGGRVTDVSRPEAARRAGLLDWPGFDLLSRRTSGARRCIEVKGRAGGGSVELSDNEWAKACNLRDEYWLYVVYDCATPRPRLLRVRDPFAKLLVRSRESLAHSVPASAILEAAE